MRPLPILLSITLWAASLGAATVTSSWQSTAGGSWFEANKWGNSPAQSAFPNNGADSFDVTVGLSHFNPYGVTFITPTTVNGTVYNSITVSNLNVAHANATFSQVGASSQLNVTGTLSVSAGNYTLAGGTLTAGAVNLSGGVLTLAGGTLSPTSVTLNGGTVVGGSLVTTGAGALHLTNAGSTLDGTQLVGGLVFLEDGGRLKLRNDSSFGLAGVTLGKSANYLHFEGSATDHDAVVSSAINLDGISSSIVLEGPGGGMTVNIAAGGSLRGRGTVYSGGSYSGVFTLANQGTVSADLAGQALALNTPNLENKSGGLIRAINGASLTVSPIAGFTNQPGATLSVTGGSTLTLQQHWHNSGALVLADTSVLNLAGSATLADLGLAGWNRSGGTVNLQAALDLAGGSLTLDASTGDFHLAGGSVKNGSLNSTVSGRLIFDNAYGNTLDAVACSGPALLDQPFGRVALRNDAGFEGDVTITAGGATLGFEGTAADPTAVFSKTLNLNHSNSRVSLEGSAPALTLSPEAVVRGMGSMVIGVFNGVSGLASVSNEGLVSADVVGQTLTLSPLLFNNQAGATVRAVNGATLVINPGFSFATSVSDFYNLPGGTLTASGGSTLTLQHGWHNSGTLSLADTSVLNLQGSFVTADLGVAGWSRTNGGGTVKLQGALNNSGVTLDLGLSGPIVLDGGTITGGVVTGVAGSDLRPGTLATSALDGVSYQGPLVFNQPNQRLRLRNDASITAKAISFTGSSCNLSFEATASDSTATLSGLSLNLDGTNNTVSLTGPSPVLTIAANSTVRGAGFFSNGASGLATVVNQGLISADVSGQTLLLSISVLTNTGALQAANGGTLSLPMALANQAAGTFRLSGGIIQVNSSGAGAELMVGSTGCLEGFGEVRFPNSSTDTLALDGTLDPTPGTGGLAIKGNLVPSATATLAFDITGATQGTGYDFVSEIGTAPLNLAGSTLKLTLGHGYTPGNAQTFTILTSNQTISGSFGNVASGARLVTADGYGSFLVTYTGASVVLGDFQPTPQAAYLAWADATFRGSSDPALVGDSADPDGDGVPNILEFALKGDPASASSQGLTSTTMQDLDPASGNEFGLTIACRQGAVFTAQPDGSQRNVNAVNSVHYTVQGGTVLGNWNAAVLHSGSSISGPAGSNLPDLTGTGWEYHTFYLDPNQATGPGRFLRVAVDNAP